MHLSPQQGVPGLDSGSTFISPCLALKPLGTQIPKWEWYWTRGPFSPFPVASCNLKSQPASLWAPSHKQGDLPAVWTTQGCRTASGVSLAEGQALGMDSTSRLLLTEPLGCGCGSAFVRESCLRTPAPTGPGPHCAVGSSHPLMASLLRGCFIAQIDEKAPEKWPRRLQ